MTLIRYLLFHKPFGVISQFSSESAGERPTLRDYIPVPGVYPVGRLDHDSEGLLLLTGDGWLQHRLTDPRYEHPKTYWAQVEGEITDDALRQLREGVRIFPDFVTRPARAERLIPEPAVPPRDPPIRFRLSVPTSWIALTITEGRNRQVRRMTAAVGFPTLRLLRVAIGELRLESLAPGAWRDASAAELAMLKPLSQKPPSKKRRLRIS
jgi:23S rRNA pseudouridine2457 synthase